MNLVDLLFVFLVALYCYRGYHRGILREGIDLISFFIGVWATVKLYPFAGALFRWFGMGRGWSNLVGVLTILIFFLVTGAILSRRIHDRAGSKVMTKPYRVGGASFAFVWSGLFALFLMVLALVIPSPQAAQAAIRNSLVGRTALAAESPLYTVLEGHAKNEVRGFLFYLRQYFAKVEPENKTGSEKCLDVQKSSDIGISSVAERQILDLVNKERREKGLKPLRLHLAIRAVARAHSSDMYRLGYFCHTDLTGKDPFDRMKEAGINYTFAGENLALAPTVALAHRGLMNSPRHRENILKPEFTDLGVGVYMGPSGLMITQNFCSGCG